jgi:hypothetical protein
VDVHFFEKGTVGELAPADRAALQIKKCAARSPGFDLGLLGGPVFLRGGFAPSGVIPLELPKTAKTPPQLGSLVQFAKVSEQFQRNFAQFQFHLPEKLSNDFAPVHRLDGRWRLGLLAAMAGKTGVVLAVYSVSKRNRKKLLALLPKKWRYFLKAGYVTRRAPLLLQSRKNPELFIDIFEWKGDAAVAKAHKDPKVLAIWDEMDKLCKKLGVGLEKLPEARSTFPHFDPIDIY